VVARGSKGLFVSAHRWANMSIVVPVVVKLLKFVPY
jgi:hypothetical protein